VTTTQTQVPDTKDLGRLSRAAAECRGCELYRNATQTVFGSGARSASIMLVGEQPGDVEDRRGEPFVGPAGQLLAKAIVEAGLARADLYLTNAVKHFRWKATATGKRRLHQRPDSGHVAACRPWLGAELSAVAPAVLVALGAVASSALFGSTFRLTQHRGEVLEWPPPSGPFRDSPLRNCVAIATIHPSAVLRAKPEDRHAMRNGLVADLALAASLVH
jgi:DNA polymerase